MTQRDRDGRARLSAAQAEARATTASIRESLQTSERRLAEERRQLEDTARRGRLAAEISDRETIAVAERFAARHRERLTLLERRVALERDELALAEQESAELAAQSGTPVDTTVNQTAEPARTPDDPYLKQRLDRVAHEAAAEAQLAFLKKKMGK
ncbi:MAG: hypothetical protein ABJC74_06750 [Gemmatimonadota bacterium]